GRAGAGSDEGDGRAIEQLERPVAPHEDPGRWIEDRGQRTREAGRRASEPANAELGEPRLVRALVEALSETAEAPARRLPHDVRAGLGREGGEHEVAHLTPSSRGVR